VNTLLINASKISALSVMLCGFLMSGQAFAAWGNDSPWSKKHEALKKQAAMEEVVLDTPVIQPVASYAEPTPVIVEAIAAPVELDPVYEPPMQAEETSQDDGILALPSSHFAVQVYASSSTDNMDKYKSNNGLEDLTAVKTDRNGAPIYVLISLHEDRNSADEAASNLEMIIGSKPWVRSVGSLQAVVMD
jgi:septal ring-binding cell division protein DamX